MLIQNIWKHNFTQFLCRRCFDENFGWMLEQLNSWHLWVSCKWKWGKTKNRSKERKTRNGMNMTTLCLFDSHDASRKLLYKVNRWCWLEVLDCLSIVLKRLNSWVYKIERTKNTDLLYTPHTHTHILIRWVDVIIFSFPLLSHKDGPEPSSQPFHLSKIRLLIRGLTLCDGHVHWWTQIRFNVVSDENIRWMICLCVCLCVRRNIFPLNSVGKEKLTLESF